MSAPGLKGMSVPTSVAHPLFHDDGPIADAEGTALFSYPELKLIQASDGLLSLLQRPVDNLLGLHPWALAPNAGLAAFTSAWLGLTEASPSTRIKTDIVRADGTVIDVEISWSRFELGATRCLFTTWRDISAAKAAHRALRMSEAKFRTLFNSTRRLIAVLTPEGRNVETNPVGYAFTGLSVEQTMALHFWEGPWWASAEDRTRVQDAVMRAAAGEYVQFEVSQRSVDGILHVSDCSITPIFRDDGTVAFLMPEANDITALKTVEAELVRREREIRSLVEHTPDGIIRYDRNFRRVFMNPAMAAFKGGSIEPFVGTTLDEISTLRELPLFKRRIEQVFEMAQAVSFQMPFTCLDGTEGLAEVNLSPEPDDQGAVSYVLAITHDITALAESHRRIRDLAYHDPLTRLPNRQSFNSRFRGMLETSEERTSGFALLMIDLDHFKTVNDTLGHAAGDELLVQVAERLKAETRDGDLVARLGGDEFAILLESVDDRSQADEIARRAMSCFQIPFTILRRELFVSASIGVSFFPDDGDNMEALFLGADTAMYQAKREGRGAIQTCSSETTAAADRYLTLSAGLRTALMNGELELYFQPKIALSDRRIIGAEALLRWNHPEFGFLTPDHFIHIAEETGLIVEIGRWALADTCARLVRWNQGAANPIKASVNLSGRQFIRNDVAEDVRAALLMSGCQASWLECEITESLLLRDVAPVHQALGTIRSLGVSIAMDDFGTGYSALSYLNQFDLNTLKIDRSFVTGMEADQRRAELVRAFIGMAMALDMQVVAEGIESEEQACLLRSFGCQVGQGYLFGRPMSASAFERLADNG